ncbi:hypothetical protein EJ065_6638 [Corallococcus coralloides]|uniref:Lipoprotein n=1 Tax=Corallococcus coralloides TaxID=184914 RepID=A0A410S1Y0_CORCK|nr:hypothetical protein [Corallococcus coralloides]QAT88164.1 hypothetical protein EJ065_6638 [Corallococcus coralloides]
MSPFRILALLAALTLAPASAFAEPEDATYGVAYVFTSVDSYTTGTNHFVVTGVLQGESAPRTIRFGAYTSGFPDAERCDRLALLTMTRPGRFHFSYFQEYFNYHPVCTLTRQ